MIDESYGILGSMGWRRRKRGRVVAAVVALGLSHAPAKAGEVQFPKDDPKVAIDVPEGWTVDVTATGLELRSPEKNSIVVAQIVARKKAVVEAWTRDAAGKLKAFGVSFAGNEARQAKTEPKTEPKTETKTEPKTGPATVPAETKTTTAPGASSVPAPAVGPAPAVPSSAATASVPSPASPPVSQAPAPPAKTADAFTFSGAPSLDTPGSVGSNQAVDPGQFSLEALSGFDGKIKKEPKLHFKTVEYFGTTMNGKPVDAELAIYTLSDDLVFLFMQESEPTDNRSVAIGQSVRGAKLSAK